MDNFIIFGAQYLFLAILLIAAVYFFLQPRSKQLQIVLLCLLVLPLAYLLLKTAALFYFDPRPFVVGHFTPLISHAPDNGFPSDHTILSAAAASIVFVYHKKLSAVLWLLTVLVGLCRVLSGLHHPADVLGSIVLATAATYFSQVFLAPRVAKTGWWKKLSAKFS